jgi:energy-coupling factor transporter ATP-binding protein EcfA2
MALTRVELENFTAFRSLKLDPCPGVNVLVGANGTGKTHLMKVCYAACDASGNRGDDFGHKLVAVFLPSRRNLNRLVRRQEGAAGVATILVARGDRELKASFVSHLVASEPVSLRPSTFTADEPDDDAEAWAPKSMKSVYVPPKEMLSNAPGFRSLYANREVHFEEVYRDILDRAYLPALRGPIDSDGEELLTRLREAIGGEVAVKGEEFFLRSEQGDLEFSLLAEGVRKLALLWLLIRNGTLQPDCILFWDEPETNLNPKLFGVVMDVLLELQRAGVQVFLATHDYVILKELDLRTTDADRVAYHAFYAGEETGGVGCDTTCNYRDIHPNAIADTFTDLYNREIRRSLQGAAR